VLAAEDDPGPVASPVGSRHQGADVVDAGTAAAADGIAAAPSVGVVVATGELASPPLHQLHGDL
jgi:hypothetical protein